MNKENDIMLWDKAIKAASELPKKEGVIDITNYEEVIPALVREAINEEKQRSKKNG